MAGLGLNTVMPPEIQQMVSQQVVEQPVVPQTETPPAQPQAQVEQPIVGEPPQAEPPKVDTFFEEFNKRYGTQYKSDDEVKPVFGLPKKVGEYEGKLKDFEKSVSEYQKKITELEELQDPLKYFSSPDAFKAEQLRIKYPKSNPDALQKIAMSDVDKMNDLDVLIKDRQLFVPDAPREEVIRKVILKKYGIDPDTDPNEWDEISVAEMKLDAAAAKEKINGLKSVIEMPQVLTKEQKEQARIEAQSKREEAVTPLKDTFLKFDKFSHKEIEGFDFDVPEEYKKALPNMFQSMFMEAGLEPTQENLNTALELREALLVHQYLPKLREIWIKEGQALATKVVDKELHNDTPPNVKTATDDKNVGTLPGLSKFVSDHVKR
jgi:hypothetical protein